ncbi:hypothetical protein ACZ87_03867 [Candidatus Erwinia dacicola]|uniref:Uncharacterized protein n=1 Tax=Candidatus Erwinia dacicola TaxID=252393 RepID=A0A328TGR6_9GAMM|nr:hypothetical protein ACZ87_03867 [Candidatus Erwinia dacicola]
MTRASKGQSTDERKNKLPCPEMQRHEHHSRERRSISANGW